ncbi:GYF domain-containing protein [Variovorax sp. Sphag1AA]|uniref:GYF domain-containing protein n=1 Tax=Variovorax sp. Sphag1AA TaxID=2587027 RepID=UPI00160A177E|nr:GYF domain-containing protein [Variovorax sp. Sphag1AA]MBB3181826.1 putative aspartyl protease [Variovorax sp. Sphag1AA]
MDAFEGRREPVFLDQMQEPGAPAMEPRDAAAPVTHGWWYANGEARSGPLSSEQIEDLLRAGTIDADTLVWREGRMAWKAVHEVPELSRGRLSGRTLDDVGFMRTARRREKPVSAVWWLVALVLAAALVWSALKFHLPENAAIPYAVGVAFGALLIPLIGVGIASLWGDGPSRSKGVKVFVGCAMAVLATSTFSTLLERGYTQRWLNYSNLTAEDFLAQAGKCMRIGDLKCQEENLRDFVRLRPDDAVGAGRLGILLNQRGKHDEAVAQFKRSLELGAGTYDLFSYLADSHEKLGHTPEAIEWSYKALSVVPTLVDVRRKLAGLLVRSQRPYEALSLLQGYDSQLEARGQQAYFVAQRISIETAIDQAAGEKTGERTALRLPVYGGHFFAPVSIGSDKPKPFMVDTGATLTSMKESLLRDSRAVYKVLDPAVRMTTADGRKVVAKSIMLESMKVGPFELTNVPAIACAECISLLGQASLSKFDMQSVRSQGVDFLMLAPR